MTTLFLLVIVLLLPVVQPKLLMVNTKHRVIVHPKDQLLLNFTIYRHCPEFTVVLSSYVNPPHTPLTTRLRFTMYSSVGMANDRDQVKMDTDSPLTVPGPKLFEKKNECPRVQTRDVEMKIDLRQKEYLLTTNLGEQILRPKSLQKEFDIYIPQSIECCMVRGVADLSKTKAGEESLMQTMVWTTPSRAPRISRSTTTTVNPIARFVEAEKEKAGRRASRLYPMSSVTTASPYLPTVAMPDPESDPSNVRNSWTNKVNEHWITTFLVFTVIICTLMLVFVVFGLSLFVCLQRPPKRSKLYKLNGGFD